MEDALLLHLMLDISQPTNTVLFGKELHADNVLPTLISMPIEFADPTILIVLPVDLSDNVSVVTVDML